MQMHVKHEPGNEWVTMKIQGVTFDMLVELDPTHAKDEWSVRLARRLSVSLH